MPGVSYTLLIDGLPAGAEVIDRIQRIEAETHVDLAGMLRLQLSIAPREEGGWYVLDEGTFSRLTNLRLAVTVGSGPPVHLIDTYVMETNARLANQPGGSTLDVVAMDATVHMSSEEKVRAWPNMSDSSIALAIFAEYGLLARVASTQPVRSEPGVTTIQRGTDISFLRRLAERNGFEVAVRPNPLLGTPEGHFHPPAIEDPTQGLLSISMGDLTTMDSFSGRQELVRAARTRAATIDEATLSVQEAGATSSSERALGARPSLDGRGARERVLPPSTLFDVGELQTYAQALANRSSWATTVEGSLSTAAFGEVLLCGTPVLLRGAGSELSGTYYTERVLHAIGPDQYTQHFTLRRNATGLEGNEPFAAFTG